MPRIPLMDLATMVYVRVDDGYPEQGVSWLRGQVGAQPVLSDREVISLLRRRDSRPYPGERPCLGFIRAHSLALLPPLWAQSQGHRRARGWRLRVAELRRHGIVRRGVTLTTPCLLDTQPVPVVGDQRSPPHRALVGSATDGVCPRRYMKDFGSPRVLLSPLEGCPVV